MAEIKNTIPDKYKEFDIQFVKVVDINDIRPNSWNPKDKETPEYFKVKHGIETYGQRLPIQVRNNPNDKSTYEIIDGEQRWTSMKELGRSKVIIYDNGKVSDGIAKKLTTWFELQVPFNQVKLAELIKDLETNDNLEDLPYDDDQIEDLLRLSEFDWEEYKNDEEHDDDEEIPTIETIEVTSDQLAIINEAADMVRHQANDKKLSIGRCLELICGDYLSGFIQHSSKKNI